MMLYPEAWGLLLGKRFTVNLMILFNYIQLSLAFVLNWVNPVVSGDNYTNATLDITLSHDDLIWFDSSLAQFFRTIFCQTKLFSYCFPVFFMCDLVTQSYFFWHKISLPKRFSWTFKSKFLFKLDFNWINFNQD